MNMPMKFAFAVSQENLFEPKHFGDADKYLIYETNKNGSFVLRTELSNSNKTIDESHGSTKKGKAIIDFLKEENVNVLVSRQYGKNIQMVNRYFTPVIITHETTDEAISVLQKNMDRINENLKNYSEYYPLINLKRQKAES
jgi:predicted Fe-Mo cluster-binding NifX family protein